MTTIRSMAFFAATAVLAAGAASAADGDVVLGFGGGWVPVIGAEPEPFFSSTDSVAGTTDGGVLYSSGKALTVWKYTAAGILDGTFGINGIASGDAIPPVGFSLGSGRGMVAAPNGDFFAVAELEGATQAGIRLCKFGSHGQPLAFLFTQTACVDQVFPGSSTSSAGHTAHSITLAPSGHIWIMGRNGDLVRFLPTGQIDPTFPGGRFFLPNLVQQQAQVYGLAIDQDGNAFVAGQAVQEQDIVGYTAKVTIGPNGPQLHPGYGNGGVRLIGCGDVPATLVCAFANVAARANDVIFYGVGFYQSGNGIAHHAVLAQVDRSSGAVPNPLLVMPALGGAAIVSPSGIAVQSSGDIVLSGTSSNGNQNQINRAFVARVSAHCGGQPQLDTTGFGVPNGWSSIGYGPNVPSEAGSVALGMDRIYIGGSTTNQPTTFTVAAFEDGESVTDGIFANGFEDCQ